MFIDQDTITVTGILMGKRKIARFLKQKFKDFMKNKQFDLINFIIIVTIEIILHFRLK